MCEQSGYAAKRRVEDIDDQSGDADVAAHLGEGSCVRKKSEKRGIMCEKSGKRDREEEYGFAEMKR